MSDPLSTQDLEGEVISEADRKEILSEIERIGAGSRIEVSEEHLAYTPQRNGALFPLLANAVGLILLGGGLFLLFTLFQSENDSIRSGNAQLVATESRLIEELQREAREQLREKEVEIEAIQARLSSISEEREQLAQNMDTQIARRAAELEMQFQAELEAERTRLLALNLSQSEFDARFAEFEAQKREEYDERLQAMRERMIAERDRIEADLDQLEREFANTLEEANRERAAIMQESEARITELEFDFQSRLAQSESELSAAAEELASLNRSRERELLIRRQIAGLYIQIRASLEDGAYERAFTQAETLEALLREPATMQIESLRQERPAELFMVRTLQEHIRTLRNRLDDEGSNDIQSALLRRVVELRSEADAALAEGAEEEAGALYRRAVETIPAVAASFAYLDQAGELRTGNDTEQDAEVEELLAGGEAALSRGEYDSALETGTRVLATYPMSSFRGRSIALVEESVDNLRAGLTREIDRLTEDLAEAEANLDGGRVASEELGTLRQENQELQERITELSDQTATLQQQRTALEQQRDSLRVQIDNVRERGERQQERNEELENQLDLVDVEVIRLERELTDFNRELAESRARVAELQAQIRIAQEEGVADPETLAELAELRERAATIADAARLYDRYRREASGLGSTSPTIDVVETKQLLDEFLGSPEVTQFFPELLREVRRFEAVYEESGRENAVIDLSDLLFEISSEDDQGNQLNRLRELRSSAKSELTQDFLNELALLLEN